MAVVFRYAILVCVCSVVCSLNKTIDIDFCTNTTRKPCELRNISVEIPGLEKESYRPSVIVSRCFSTSIIYECKPTSIDLNVRVLKNNRCTEVKVQHHVKCKPNVLTKQRVKKKCENFPPCTTGTKRDKNCGCKKNSKRKNREDRKKNRQRKLKKTVEI